MLVLSLPARFPLRFVLALLLGALHAMAFVDDRAWPIEIAALAGLVALVLRATRELEDVRGTLRAARGGAVVGFGFGLGWFVTGVSWIYISLHTYGEMNALIAGAGVFLLAAYLALFPALACALFAAFLHRWRPGPMASIACFAGLWTLGEFGRGTLFTGFPWLAAGYAHVAGPLAGYAPILGVYGTGLLAAAIAAVVALAAMRRGREGFSAMLSRLRFTLVLVLIFGVPFAGHLLRKVEWSEPAGAPIAVSLLQGNVPQDMKFVESRFDDIANDYMKLVESRKADLIVLPETAFPRFLSDLPEELGKDLATTAREKKAAIAFGIPIAESGGRYYNSVLAIDPAYTGPGDAASEGFFGTLKAQRYDKAHLVPFGEFIPTGFRWFVNLMNMPLGDFTRGTDRPEPMTLAGRRVAFDVCYEDLFGAEIIRQVGPAEILVNVSNVAWFGDSMALPQHLDISRMRAIETARPMLRATNTGMTASIDPHGRVLAKLDPFTKGALDVRVQGMTGFTPFAHWGNLPALGLSVVLLAAGWIRARTGRRR